MRNLAMGQPTVIHPGRDAALLVEIALRSALHAPRGQAVGVAGLRIVALVIDGMALGVLRALDARRPGGGHASTTGAMRIGGATSHAVDARRALLQARGFARGQLAALEALIDALLLRHVAIGEVIDVRGFRCRRAAALQSMRCG